MKDDTRLGLSEAVKSGRLDAFVAQEEARGIGPVAAAAFDQGVAALFKAPQSKDRTSRSSSADGLSEKQIRQDKGRRAAR